MIPLTSPSHSHTIHLQVIDWPAIDLDDESKARGLMAEFGIEQSEAARKARSLSYLGGPVMPRREGPDVLRPRPGLPYQARRRAEV